MSKAKREESIRQWFPRNLKIYMTMRGVTNAEMCERLSISRQALNCWLRGKNAIDYIRIDQIAKVLNVPVGQLMTPMSEKSIYIGGQAV